MKKNSFIPLMLCAVAILNLQCGTAHIVATDISELSKYRKVAVVPVELKIDSEGTRSFNISQGIQKFISDKLKSGTTMDLKMGDQKNAEERVKDFLDFISETINKNLLLHRFTPIERTRVTAIMEEIGLQQTGIVDQKQAYQIGKVSKADAIFLGRLYIKEVKGLLDTDVYYTFSGRLVSVEEGVVLLSGELKNESGEEEITLDEIRELVDDWFRPVPNLR